MWAGHRRSVLSPCELNPYQYQQNSLAAQGDLGKLRKLFRSQGKPDRAQDFSVFPPISRSAVNSAHIAGYLFSFAVSAFNDIEGHAD
jgi:hypothetical protein